MLSNQIQAKVGISTIQIYVQNWKFLATGQGHIILQNIQPKDQLFTKILRVCKHPLDTLPAQFQKVYQQIIAEQPHLSKYLHKKQQVTFEESHYQTFRSMINILSNTQLEKFRVFFAQHLTKNKENWDYVLQFKPKTPLPDVYSHYFIQKISSQHKIQAQQVKDTLKSNQPKEHLRWFKKNVFKQNCNNLNSLQIFSVLTSQKPNYLSLIKPLHQSNNPQNPLNNEQLSQILNRTNVFKDILKLQLLHNHESDFSMCNPFKLWSDEQQKHEQLQEAKKSIRKFINDCKDPKSILESQYKNGDVIESEIKNKNNFESILRFLLSWTLRDISFMLRVKLNNEGSDIQRSDLKIIDYELKDATKLSQTIEKDSSFLVNYLKFKGLL